VIKCRCVGRGDMHPDVFLKRLRQNRPSGHSLICRDWKLPEDLIYRVDEEDRKHEGIINITLPPSTMRYTPPR
jgi:hypothetical protein